MPKPKPKFTSYLIRKKIGDNTWDEMEVARTEPTAESILEKYGEGTYRVTAIGPSITKTLWEEKLGGVIDKELSKMAEQAGNVGQKTESVAAEELGQKIETIQKISEHEARLDELQANVGELKEEVSFLKNWAESNGGTKEKETILTADDPHWQMFASVCNKLGNLGKDSPRDVLSLLLRAYTNVAEKSGNLNLKMRG